jgi:hypothetical protein
MYLRLQSRQSRILIGIGLLALSIVIAACATTRQTRRVKPQGFLGDYSDLKKGKGKEAQLVYINPDTDWSSYNAIIIDSVTVWHESKAAKISVSDAKKLTDFLYARLQEQLSQDYTIANYPGPGVMRLRAAITEAKGARVVGNAITTIVPQMRLLSNILGRTTNVQVWVGKAAIEADITDSMTHERLAAAVDERAGGKALRSIGGKWKDVNNIFKYWAERLRKRLEELRAS